MDTATVLIGFAELALVLGACLTMLIGLVHSFPLFDVHRKDV